MTTRYQIYHESVVKLVATLVLKDRLTCEIINSRLKQLGYDVDEDDKRSWKYYLNLSGRYHVSDVPMTVTSMDTHEEIDFTVENLELHRATWREYQYGSRFYKELLAKYPRQDMLINGILNPVDIDEAIAAPDHTILWYDKTQVESREINLIPELQSWVHAQFIRWDNNDYRINNAYYVSAKLAILFMAMPSVVKNIRLANARTIRAHSYHIKRYLASFGPLDQHYEAMNEFQRLYFYRNIRYLLKNNGKTDIFETLVQNVMTERRFPVSTYQIQHNDESIVEDMAPKIQFARRSLNGIPAAIGEDIIDTPTMLSLQRKKAESNPEEELDAESYVPARMMRSLSSNLETKVLESSVLDLKEAEPYTLAECLLNHWIYFANSNLYRAVIMLTLPDGGDAIRLSMQEAYLAFQYVYFRKFGIELTTIPRIMAKRVRRIPLPTFEELRALAPTSQIPDSYIRHAMKDNVIVDSYISIEAFTNACIRLRDREQLHRDLYLFREDLHEYAFMKIITDRFYADIPITVHEGEPYVPYLESKGLFFEKYSPAELDEIAMSILNSATGVEFRTAQTLKDVQTAMLDIMGRMSSYSVHYIQEINEEAVMSFDWPHLRWHYLGGEAAHDLRWQIPLADPTNLTSYGHQRVSLDIGDMQIRSFDRESKHTFQLPVGIDMELSGLNQKLERALILHPFVSVVKTPPLDLDTIDGTEMGYPEMQDKSITQLFKRGSLDEFNYS